MDTVTNIVRIYAIHFEAVDLSIFTCHKDNGIVIWSASGINTAKLFGVEPDELIKTLSSMICIVLIQDLAQPNTLPNALICYYIRLISDTNRIVFQQVSRMVEINDFVEITHGDHATHIYRVKNINGDSIVLNTEREPYTMVPISKMLYK